MNISESDYYLSDDSSSSSCNSSLDRKRQRSSGRYMSELDADLAKLDSSFQKLTNYADALLDSIRNENDSRRTDLNNGNETVFLVERSNYYSGTNNNDDVLDDNDDGDDDDLAVVEGNCAGKMNDILYDSDCDSSVRHDDEEMAREMQKFMASEELGQRMVEEDEDSLENFTWKQQQQQQQQQQHSVEEDVVDDDKVGSTTLMNVVSKRVSSFDFLDMLQLIFNMAVMVLLGRILFQEMYYLWAEEKEIPTAMLSSVVFPTTNEFLDNTNEIPGSATATATAILSNKVAATLSDYEFDELAQQLQFHD